MAHARHHNLGKAHVAVRQRRNHANRAQQRFLLDEICNERRRGHALNSHLAEDAQVLRVVHAGNHARHVKHALRDLARHQIAIVLARSCHKHIGSPNARILLIVRIASIAPNDQIATLKLHRKPVGATERLFDNGYLVAALQQNLSQIRPNLSSAGNNDVHVITLSQPAWAN